MSAKPCSKQLIMAVVENVTLEELWLDPVSCCSFCEWEALPRFSYPLHHGDPH